MDTCTAVSYVVTPKEYALIATRLHRLSSRAGIPISLPPLAPPTKASVTEQHHFHASVSRRAIRLFALAYGLTNLYENAILGLLRRKGPLQFIRDLPSTSALRLALFVSSYSTIYRLLLVKFKQLFPPSSDLTLRARMKPYLPPFLAGVAASPAMLLDTGDRKVGIAVYVATKALQSSYEALAIGGVIPKVLNEGRWFWGGHLIFALSNAILLHAFVFTPSSFPSSYSSFILGFSKPYLPTPTTPSPTWPTPRAIVDAIASSSLSLYPSFSSPLLHSTSSLLPSPSTPEITAMLPILASSHPGHSQLICAFLHPRNTSCSSVFKSAVSQSSYGATKFFSTLALVGSLVRWKSTIKNPESAILSAITSTLTSSAFLSLSISSAWSTICLFQSLLPNTFLPTSRFYLQGFLAGLWVTLTTIGSGRGAATRATDLGWYAGRLAIRCAWDVGVKSGRVRNFKNGEVAYFALGMGALMALSEVNPGAIDSSFMRSALKKLGSNEIDPSSTIVFRKQ